MMASVASTASTDDHRRDALVLLGCPGAALLFTLLLADNRNDDAYITYRHTQNLLAGEGHVFNRGSASREPRLRFTACSWRSRVWSSPTWCSWADS
jgi:hypothetical protein